MKFSAVSLFSGAGGMDIGFDQANFEIVFANDLDNIACDTYDSNHVVKISRGPLAEFKTSLKKFKSIDIVFGGPPCQGFSVAGKMDPDDERSLLIWDFFDVIEDLKPRAFICENVKALAVNKRWENIRKGLIQKAENLGYTTILILLNSNNYNVPQSRERMFLIGFKEKKHIKNQNLFFDFSKKLSEKKKKPNNISTLIKSLGKAGSSKNNRVCNAKITYAKKPIMRKSPYAGMIFNGAGRPINPNGLALTLPASMGGNKTPIVDEEQIFDGNNSFIETYHNYLLSGGTPYEGEAPNRLRRVTINEAMGIQTFPQNYQFSGKNSAIYRQIGNAVPPNLANVVARSVHETLKV